MLNWVKDKWDRFELWFHETYLPGLKTRLILYGGFIGSTAGALQEYYTQLPLSHYVSAETVAIGGVVITLLAIWFRGMGERVAETKDEG